MTAAFGPALLAFMGGTWAGLHLWRYSDISYLLPAAALACPLLIRAGGRAAAAAACSFALCLGLWNGLRAGPAPESALVPYFGMQAEAEGDIDPESFKVSPEGLSFTVNCLRLRAEGRDTAYGGGLRVFISAEEAERWQRLSGKRLESCGRITIAGRLRQLRYFRNPGGFDAWTWNMVRGLGGSLAGVRVLGFTRDDGLAAALARLNAGLRETIAGSCGGQEGALLGGMLLGGGEGLEEEVRESFAANGLAHMLSVSGAHLVLLAGLLSALLRFLPPFWRKTAVLLALTAYAGLCGFKAPVLRALLMGGAALYGGSGAGRGLPLMLTAAVLLAFRPLWLLDLGFQLSFGASAGLAFLLPKLRGLLEERLPSWLAEPAAVTMAAQLAVLPLEAACFHRVSLAAPLGNILLLPVLEFSAVLALGGLALEACLGLGEPLLAGAGFLAGEALRQSELLASLPFAAPAVGTLPLWCWLLYYVCLLLWLDVPALRFLRGGERRLAMLAAAAAICCCLLWQQYGPRPLAAYFLDVGQGDCAVIRTPSRQIIVIDTGGLKNFATGSRIAAPFIRSLGHNRIDLLLLSHWDYDHAGGAPSLAAAMPVGKIVLPRQAPDGESRGLYGRLLSAYGGALETAAAGMVYAFGETRLEIVRTPAAAAKGNGASTVASVSWRGRSLLFTGDLEAEQEGERAWGRCDVLKAGHHGSRGSTSAGFLRQVRPRLTVISCGSGNRYGHPHRETLERLREAGSSIARTDLYGCLKTELGPDGVRCYAVCPPADDR